jgi:pimeloyl-ACP methyl ester carboxylesterase
MPGVSPVTTRLATKELSLAIHSWGGDGAPVLLSHATGFHGQAWAEVAQQLVEAGRQVWSFDFRGHGDSDAPSLAVDDYAWAGFARDVAAVADALELTGRPDLLVAGHSKGAAALLLAEADRPDSFARIWAYEPIVFRPGAEGAPRNDFLASSARKRRNAWDSIEAARASYASKPPLNQMTDASLRAYVDYGFRDRGDGVFELKCPPEVEAQVYTMAPENGAFDRLPKINAPVHVVVGELSRSIDPRLGAEIVDQLPHGTLEVMPGLDHFGPQQDPDACVASLLRFADQVPTH